MTTRRTSQILVLLVGLFGVLAFVCACKSKPDDFPNGPSMETWLRNAAIPIRAWSEERTGMSSPLDETSESEIPKLSEP